MLQPSRYSDARVMRFVSNLVLYTSAGRAVLEHPHRTMNSATIGIPATGFDWR
jgi:hypothetical protein